MKPEEGHAQIATACLRYLSFHFLRGGICATKFSYEARLRRYPCIRYAVLYFDYHIAALPKVPPDLRIRLEKFLSQPERSLSAAAQIRRDELDVRSRGSMFAYLPWPANASTFIDATRLHSVQDIRSDHESWHQGSPPCTLHAACWEGKVDVVTALMEKGHDPIERDWQGRTPLYYAALQGFGMYDRLILFSIAKLVHRLQIPCKICWLPSRSRCLSPILFGGSPQRYPGILFRATCRFYSTAWRRSTCAHSNNIWRMGDSRMSLAGSLWRRYFNAPCPTRHVAVERPRWSQASKFGICSCRMPTTLWDRSGITQDQDNYAAFRFWLSLTLVLLARKQEACWVVAG